MQFFSGTLVHRRECSESQERTQGNIAMGIRGSHTGGFLLLLWLRSLRPHSIRSTTLYLVSHSLVVKKMETIELSRATQLTKLGKGHRWGSGTELWAELLYPMALLRSWQLWLVCFPSPRPACKHTCRPCHCLLTCLCPRTRSSVFSAAETLA